MGPSARLDAPGSLISSSPPFWGRSPCVSPSLTHTHTHTQVAAVLRLFHWALQQRRPALVTHLLVDVDEPAATTFGTTSATASGSGLGRCVLAPVFSVYLGRALLGADGADLEDLSRCGGGGGGRLAFASARYASQPTGTPTPTASASAATAAAAHAAQVADFLCKCGARRAVALTAATREMTGAEVEAYLGGKVTHPAPV